MFLHELFRHFLVTFLSPLHLLDLLFQFADPAFLIVILNRGLLFDTGALVLVCLDPPAVGRHVDVDHLVVRDTPGAQADIRDGKAGIAIMLHRAVTEDGRDKVTDAGLFPQPINQIVQRFQGVIVVSVP